MGGTGVTTAQPGNGALFNPALIYSHDPDWRESWSGHIYAGARLLDRNNMVDRIDDLNDLLKQEDIEALIDNTKVGADGALPDSNDLRKLSDLTDTLQLQLESLSGEPVRASTSYGASLSHDTNRFSVGIYGRQYLVLGARVDFAFQDQQNLTQMSDFSTALANALDLPGFEVLLDDIDQDAIEGWVRESRELGELVPELQDWRSLDGIPALLDALGEASGPVGELIKYIDVEKLKNDLLAANGIIDGDDINPETFVLSDISPADYLIYEVPDSFTTSVDFSGAEVHEIAVTFATALGEESQWKLGASVKTVQFETIEFSQPLGEVELTEHESSTSRVRQRHYTMDLGLTYNVNHRVALGLVGRNVIPFTLDTVSGRKIAQRPIFRAGLGYQGDRLNLALDIDLTRNEPLGFDPDKRYLALGVEYFVWQGSAVRFGYRYNEVDQTGLYSIGFGVGFRQGHVDIGAARSDMDNEWSLGLQLGFQF